MFEENENPVIEDITENVDDLPTEELVDGAVESEGQEPVQNTEPVAETFTKEQVDEMIAKKLARKEAKIRKEYDKKYGRLENVLRVGMEEDDVEVITDQLADFYTERGKQIPSIPQYSQREMEILADAEAKDIIESGYDEITDELNRLSDIGFDNMTPSDKHIFLKLKQEADRITNERELKSIGITELPEDFKEFANKLNPDMSLKEKYEMYTKFNPKKKGEPMGSMKSTSVKDNGVKPYYSPEEASKFTRKDYDANPDLFNAVCESMTKWK